MTHFILHAGRIFWQQHHNHIICLVIDTALHVYKGQFSPWLGQFTYHGNSSPVFIGFNLCFSQHTVLSAQPPDFACFGVSKTLRFWPQSYIIFAYIINFQVQLSPGKIHIKFELRILGLYLSVCWVLGFRKEKSVLNNRVTNTMRYRYWSSGLLNH